MLAYPSITSAITYDAHVWAFEKIDGSQIRAEWSSKRGFYKLGSRKQLIGEENYLRVAGDLLAPLQDKFAETFEAERWDRAVCFFELAGPNSFAGGHDPNDQLTLTLFDVATISRGLFPPKRFVELFEHVPISMPVYRGLVTEEFVESVRTSTVLREGVVCKTKNGQMFKIKTRAWIARVKECYGHDPAKLKELL